ncbi:MAG TPA: MlaD family protein [Nocardioides sp.]|nr:MlaD family protein [Nocardioides sp.]
MSELDAHEGMGAGARLGVVVCFALLCGSIFGFLWINSGGKVPLLGSSGYTVAVDLPRAANVVYFSDVMVAGVKVGKVVSVEADGDHAHVVMRLDGAVAPLHRGASVEVGAKSLVEESYLDVTDGTGPVVASGSTLAPGAGKATTQLSDVLDTLDAPTRASVRRVLRSLGAGTRGTRSAVSDALQGLGDLGDHGRTVFDALAAQSADIKGLTRSSTRVLAALASRRAQLSQMVSDTNLITGATAGQQQDVRRAVRALPGVMTSARGASDDLERLAGSLGPVARNLRSAAAPLTRALNELPATSRDLRATMPSLTGTLRAAPATLTRVPAFTQQVDGLLPPAAAVLAQADPMLGYLQPYGRDIAAWFTNFAQTIALGDRNGKAFRVMPVLNDQSLTGQPLSSNVGPLNRFSPLPGPGTLQDPTVWGGRTYPHVGGNPGGQ